MSNLSKHSLRCEVHDDVIIVHTVTGPVSCSTPESLWKALQRGVAVVPEQRPVLKEESMESYLARGGKVLALTAEARRNLTIEDLDL